MTDDKFVLEKYAGLEQIEVMLQLTTNRESWYDLKNPQNILAVTPPSREFGITPFPVTEVLECVNGLHSSNHTVDLNIRWLI